MMEEPLNGFDEEITCLVEQWEASRRGDGYGFFDADDLEHIAEFYLAGRKMISASEALEYGMAMFPYSAMLLYRQGQWLAMRGKLDEAIEIMKRAAVLEPANHEARMAIAGFLDDLGEHEDALKEYEALLEMGLQREEILLQKAYVHQALDQDPEAIACLEELLVLSPGNLEAVHELAQCYQVLDGPARGVALLKAYTDAYPEDRHGWFHLGMFNLMAEDYDGAVEAYEFAGYLGHDKSSCAFNVGNIRVLQEDYESAVDAYESGLLLEPDNVNILCQLGACFKLLERHKDARAAFKRALGYDEKCVDALSGIGLSYYHEDQYPSAIHYLQKAVRIENDNDAMWLQLGHCYMGNENFESCEAAYKKALDLVPESVENLMEYIYSLFLNDKIEEAFAKAEEGLGMHENNADLLALMAGLLYEAKMPYQADIYLQHAMAQDTEAEATLFEYFYQLEEDAHVQQAVMKYRG